MNRFAIRLGTLALCLGFSAVSLSAVAQTGSTHAAAANPSSTVVLKASEASKLVPATVFFRGQVAPTQGRNSGGVHFTDGMYVLAALVDASGYSTSIQQKYQAYLITEAPLEFDGHTLPAGAYGMGFRENNQFTIMDLGNNDVFTISSKEDANLHRPMPLQVLAGDAPNSYRLYEGRAFVTFTRSTK